MHTLCIHGSGACCESWHYQLETFTNLSAVDLPGHPEGTLIPTIPGMVEWLHRHVQYEGLSDLILCGHSLGGGVVLEYALTYPSEVHGLILVGTGAKLRVLPKTLETLAQNIDTDAPWNPLAGYEDIEPQVAEILGRRRVENGLEARLNDLRACDRFDVTTRLGKISAPALAICGSLDVMTPPKYTHFLAEHLPNARSVVIEGGTHQVHLEKPAEVNREIAAFIATL